MIVQSEFASSQLTAGCSPGVPVADASIGRDPPTPEAEKSVQPAAQFSPGANAPR